MSTTAAAPKPGSFSADGDNAAAVALFDPRKRYRHMLRQCTNAEAADNDRVRFLCSPAT
jgi:uncharacterized membrane-anchored protein